MILRRARRMTIDQGLSGIEEKRVQCRYPTRRFYHQPKANANHLLTRVWFRRTDGWRRHDQEPSQKLGIG
jgi:hypothetical protein